MGIYKTKAIQADLGTFTHIPAYSDISRHIQPDIIGIFRTLCNPDIFRTLANSELDAYSEPWQIHNQTRIQNLGIFKNLAYSEHPGLFKTLAYSEPEAYS